MDVHVPWAVTEGLRRRSVDVLTAQDDSTEEIDDPELLDRATALDRVLVSRDEDLLSEGTARQRSGVFFAGIVYAHQQRVNIGQFVRDLELLAKAYEPADIANRIEHLPLK